MPRILILLKNCSLRCKAMQPEISFYLDIPEVNPHAKELAEKYGLQKVFETARMYTKQTPSLPLDKIYGVTTFELG